MFGIEEYYNDLLLEAKSPEELKKILEYQFVEGKGVPIELLNYLTTIDPTRKYTYTRWLLFKWETEKDLILKSVKEGTIKRLFNFFKDKSRDGLDINNMKSLKQALEMLPDVDPILDKSEGTPEENDFDIVYDTPEWTIAVPHTYEAAKKLGRGCRWCTADAFGNGEEFYKKYSSYGPLWVNFDKRKGEEGYTDHKPYPYTRYQFLFEWDGGNGEFMDSRDNRIVINGLDYPEGVIDFYTEQNPDYGEAMTDGVDGINATNREYYEERRMEMKHLVLVHNDMRYLGLLPVWNNEYRTEGVDWYLYDEEDTSDPVFPYLSFDPENYHIKTYEDTELALLRTTNNDTVAVYGKESANGGWYQNFSWEADDTVVLLASKNAHLIIGNDVAFLVSPNGGMEPINLHDELEKIEAGVESISDSPDIANFIHTHSHEYPGLQTYNGTFVELHYSDGFAGLVYFDKEGYDFCVRREKLVGEHFEPFMKGNALHVRGGYFDYSLDDPSSNYHIIDDFGSDDYIVQNEDGWQNVYLTKLKKFLFEHPFKKIEYQPTVACDLAICSTNNEGYLFYNANNAQQVGEEVEEINRYPYSQHMYWTVKKGGARWVYDFDQDEPKIYGPYRWVNTTKLKDGYVVAGDNNGLIVLFNAPEGKFLCTPKDEFRNYGVAGFFRDGTDCVILAGPDKSCLFNYVTGQVVLNGISTTVAPDAIGYLKQEDGRFLYIWRAILGSDNKKNILMAENRPLINEPVEIVERGTEKRDNILYVPIISNEKVFIVQTDGKTIKLLPNPNGIDFQQAELLSCTAGYTFAAVVPNEKRIVKFIYRPWETGVNQIQLLKNDFTNTDDYNGDLRFVFSLILPKQAEIQENFKRIYKSIIDTEIRRNKDE